MGNSPDYGYMTFNHGLCDIGVPKCVFLSIMKLVVVDHIIIIQLLNLHFLQEYQNSLSIMFTNDYTHLF